MTPRDDAGRQFSDDVERLLHGEEPLGGNADADYLDTILFARKLVDLGQEPDAEFALRLRRRLATEMAAQDAKSRDTQSWFVRLFSRPGLRLAVVSTFVVLAAVGLVWRAGLLSPASTSPSEDASAGMLSAPPSPLAPETSAPEVARAQADGNGASLAMPPASTTLTITGHVEPTAAFGETVNISFEFLNAGPDGYLLTPFPPTIAIREAATGRIVFISVAGVSDYSLAAMESIQYDFTWNQKDDSGVQVEPGRYEVDVETIEAQPEKGGTPVPTGASGVAAFAILPQAADGTAGGIDAK